jgi:phosphoribosylformylglycinamidine synthase
LLRNRELKFVCRPVRVRVETTDSPFTSSAQPGQVLTIPVAHGEGCYFADPATLAALRRDNRVVLRYVDNPNGSLDDIAGICNEKRNVMGMMPHPERASDALLGCTDGKVILESMIHSLSAATA